MSTYLYKNAVKYDSQGNYGFYTVVPEPCAFTSYLHQRLHSQWQEKDGEMFARLTLSCLCKNPFVRHSRMCVSPSESMSKHSMYLISLTAWLK